MSVVRLGGPLRTHLAAAIEQLNRSTPYSVDLVVQDVRAAPGKDRLFQDYRGDLSGRYLDAVAVAHAQGVPVDESKTTEVLRAVLGCRNPDGTFGPPAPAIHVDHGSAWGHGRLLDGLLSARQWAPAELAEAVEQASTGLVGAISTRSDRWAAWTAAHAGEKFHLDPLSAVLPLTRYAEATGAESALLTARKLIAALPPGDADAHMHGYLLALRGQLEVGRLTGDDRLIDDVVRRSDAVAERHLLPHGAVLESTAWPWDVNTEGCGIADWVMLNLRLYDLAGDDRFLDRTAIAALNALLHVQRESGHFGCETRSDADGLLVSDYAPEAWWCCTFHSIRALHDLAEHAVVRNDDTVRIVLPLDATLEGPQGDPVVTVAGGYPYDDTVSITIGTGFAGGGTLQLLVPSTASLASAAVNGAGIDADTTNGSLTLTGLLPGNTVEIQLNQHDWFSVDGHVLAPPFVNTTEDAPDLSTKRCALFHGPLLLAAHAGDNEVEDVLRARYAVHDPTRSELVRDEDAVVKLEVAGHDTFHRNIVLRPLAGPDRRCNDQPVRVWYPGLRYARRTLHHH